MSSLTEDVLDDFRRTIEEASARLLSMTEDESRAPLAEGKWSAKETIGHLVDSAANNHQRFVRAQFKDDLVFEGYAQEDWVRAQGYNEEPWPLLVGFHGYAETAGDHMDALRAIPGTGEWLLVSIQALHPFYARKERVVASWMTRSLRA